MTRFNLICVAAVFGLLGGNAAAEILYDEKHCWFSLTGEITAADAEALAGTNCGPSDLVHLFLFDSPGGDVRAATTIGRWLREINGAAIVRSNSFCHSSCALVYIGGTYRWNLGQIGLHRPYLAGAPRPDDEVRSAVASMLANVRAYVAEMGVTSEFTNIMLNTPPAGMRIFHQNAIEPLVPRDDPLQDELLTAFSAKQYGLSTDEFRRRDAEAQELCADYARSSSVDVVHRTTNCLNAIRWGLSISVFLQRRDSAGERCTQGNEVSIDDWEAWQAEGQNTNDHPLAIERRDCIIAVMQGR